MCSTSGLNESRVRKELIYFSHCMWLCGFIFVSLRGSICFFSNFREKQSWLRISAMPSTRSPLSVEQGMFVLVPSESREQTFCWSTGNRPLNPFQYCHWDWYALWEGGKKKKLELDWNGIIKVKWNALFWFKCRMMLRDLANRILFLFSLWGSSW